MCGVRDVRDYRIHSSAEKAIITGGSAFNIKARSLRLGNFSYEEMIALYQQHTEETGQVFTTEALGRLWELTQGQPSKGGNHHDVYAHHVAKRGPCSP